MINDILNSIGSFLSGGGDPKTIRSSILDALPNDDTLKQYTMDARPPESKWGKRSDGSEKGDGYFGPLKRPDGNISTEISIGVDLGEGEMEIPTLVPTLTRDEIDSLLSGDMTDQIVNKAVEFAKRRMSEGKDVWASNEEIVPVPERDIKQTLLPETARFSNPIGFEVPDYEDAEETNNPLEPFFKVDTRPDSVIKAERDRQLNDAGIAEQDIVEDRLGLTQNRGQAMKEYIDRIKKLENPEKKGFVTQGGVGKFMMFKSIDEAKVPGLSEYEIGYGIKVKDDWLKPDKTKWPKINGVYVDVTKGLTVQQVDSLLEMRAGKDRAVASDLLNKWGDMTEQEKSAWTDLTYNGGSKAIKLNKNARAAANNGYTLEGLVRVFDYIHAGKNRYRGMLNRRVNVYNKAALSVTGAPVVEEYKWGEDGVMVKFSSSLRSEKYSKAFRDKINKNDGWYTVPTKGEGKSKTYKVGDGYQFE